MFKNLYLNRKGGIVIETVIVLCIILAVGIAGFLYLYLKMDSTQKDMEKGLAENYSNKEVVFDLKEPGSNGNNPGGDGSGNNGGDWDDNEGDNEGDDLLTDNGNEFKQVRFSQVLDRTKNNNRSIIVTLPNLESISNIYVNNGGKVEVLSVDGDEVIIKITDGQPVDYVVISGEYIPYSEKYITAYLTPDYIDEQGYKGTLTKYIHETIPAENKSIEISLESNNSNFPATQPYWEGSISTTLYKNGNPLEELIKGSESKSKFITNSISPNYTENVTDNGINTAYEGVLTPYVYQGSSASSKEVTNQDSETYTEYLNDNGVSSYYTGTLDKYLVGGYEADSKIYTMSEYNYTNNVFPDTKVVTDGLYSGTVTKYGSVSELIGGSAPISKYVDSQTTPYYNDGTYSGTLEQYVIKGSPADSKHVTAQSNQNYSDAEGYTGTLTQYVYSGNAPLSKDVTGHPTQNYNDGVYSGTLTRYVSGGKAPETKYMSGELSGGISHLKQTFGPGYTYWYDDGTFKGNLYLISERHNYHPNGVSLTFTYEQFATDPNDISLQNLDWETIRLKLTEQNPEITNIRIISAAWDGPIQYGSFYSDGVYYGTKRNASGTVLADGWEVVGTIGGDVTSADTRTYAYHGTVWTTDTRVYRYQGYVVKPDTREFAYRGTVWTADTRYTYWKQNYSGTLNRPDSREYRYKGTVTKPDTRVYRYEGNVIKPDTRVYKYTQSYKGNLYIPEEPVYRYQGNVVREAFDDRRIDYFYEYKIDIDYFEK